MAFTSYDPFAFKAIDSYVIKDRGRAYVVELTMPCDDFYWLVGRRVTFDGHPFCVKAVECGGIGPWQVGDRISLLAFRVP